MTAAVRRVLLHASIAAWCVTCVAVAPGHALQLGQQMPPPPVRTAAGDSIDVTPWLAGDLVAWYLFDATDPDAADAMRWLAPPKAGRGGFRAVGVPLGGAPSADVSAAATGVVPLLADGDRWKVQLGPGVRPPLLLITRPPGIVIAVAQGAGATPRALATAMLSLHVQREDWAGAQDVIARAGSPLVDPTFHAARAVVARGSGDLTVARDEARGLAEVGHNARFKGAGHALVATLALRTGDGAGAEGAAKRGGPVPEALAVRAQLALVDADLQSAYTNARRAADGDAVFPWSAGAHDLLVSHVALLQGQLARAERAATAATRRAPGSWRAWQTLGLVRLRRGDFAGLELLRIAAAIGPDAGAGPLAHAAQEAMGGQPQKQADVVIALEAGSIPHARWPGAGPTACLRLAAALEDQGVDTVVLGLDADSFTGGEAVELDAVRVAARARGARYLVLLRMHVAGRGVMLNARVIAAESGGLRGLDSMTWTPDLTLRAACDALADRVRPRLRVGG